MFERWTPRTHESPRELARQSEAKSKQVEQSASKRGKYVSTQIQSQNQLAY